MTQINIFHPKQGPAKSVSAYLVFFFQTCSKCLSRPGHHHPHSCQHLNKRNWFTVNNINLVTTHLTTNSWGTSTYQLHHQVPKHFWNKKKQKSDNSNNGLGSRVTMVPPNKTRTVLQLGTQILYKHFRTMTTWLEIITCQAVTFQQGVQHLCNLQKQPHLCWVLLYRANDKMAMRLISGL